jgi:hypothetical protein
LRVAIEGASFGGYDARAGDVSLQFGREFMRSRSAEQCGLREIR